MGLFLYVAVHDKKFWFCGRATVRSGRCVRSNISAEHTAYTFMVEFCQIWKSAS